MKKRTSETLRAIALLAFFSIAAALSALLIYSQFGTWKDAHFRIGRDATPDAWYPGFLILIGSSVFGASVLCVVNLLRYDLGAKRKRRK